METGKTEFPQLADIADVVELIRPVTIVDVDLLDAVHPDAVQQFDRDNAVASQDELA